MHRDRFCLASLVLACASLVACGGSDASDTVFGQTGSSGAGQGGGKAQAGASQGGAGQGGGKAQAGAPQGGASQGGAAQGGGGGTSGMSGSSGAGKAGAAGGSGKAGAAGASGKAGAAGASGKAGAAGGSGKAGAAGASGKAGAGGAGSAGAPGGSGGAGGDPGGGAGGASGGNAGGAAGAGGSVQGADKCPGAPLSVGPGAKVEVDGSTLGAAHDARSENGMCGGSSSNDVVYEVTPTVSGRLVVDSTTTYSGSIYARAACDSEGSQLDCDGNGSGQSISFDVKAGVPIYLFVDGYGQQNQAGGYHLSLQLIECGDGVVQSGEECDDHNTNPGDGCGGTCRFEQGGACDLQNVEPSSRAQPRNAPAQCLTAVFAQPVGPQQGIGDNGADEDWFCIEVAEGRTLVAGTFQSSITSCNLPGNRDTIVEIYKGAPASDPSNTSCTGSQALVCDDNSGPDVCSEAVYTVPAGEGGTYCARVIDDGKNGSIQYYSAFLAVQ